jgi:integrase/recombinase XerD
MNTITVKSQNILSTTKLQQDNLIDIWLSNKKLSTQKTYRSCIKQFFRITELTNYLQISYLQITTFEHWLRVNGYKENTIRLKLNVVKSLIGFLNKQNLLPDPQQVNLMKDYQTPKEEPPLHERILSETEFTKLLEAASVHRRDYLILITTAVLGLRASELVGLKYEDIRENYISIRGKGGKNRTLIVPEWLLEEVSSISGKINKGYIFKSINNKKLSPMDCHRIIKKYVKKANLNERISFHWLRHFHAVEALKAGCSLEVLQQGLGHSSLNTTQRYLHIMPNECSSNYIKYKSH